MTAAFSERDWDRIERAAYTEFVTNAVVSATGGKRNKVRKTRTEQVEQAYRKFRDAMENPDPPQSRDEAIRQVVGLLGKLLAIVFPNYALLIQIIGFLWDVSTGQNVTIAGVASGAAEGQT